jgi:beta-N-acetylhexosaminidase
MGELETTAGHVIVCGFDGTTLPPRIERWLERDSVAGLILFKRNLESIEQAKSLLDRCAAIAGCSLPPLLSVDQEGGRVARLREPVLPLPPMRLLAKLDDLALTMEAGEALGRQLRAIGFNLDFAPVLDVDTNPQNPVIGDRSFGADPEEVVRHALAFAEGLHRGGVLSCGKHFPGHGDTDLDSHLALPRLRHARDRLDAVELLPFRAAVGALPSLMTAHVVFEGLDPDVPATMSERAIQDLLRNEIGYQGAVFSDDLEMKAVSDRYSIEEAGVRAIAAGCDLLLVCSDVDAAERLRERLVREAESSETFRRRLLEARGRADSLRERAAQLGAPATLENALHHPQARAVEARLAQFA